MFFKRYGVSSWLYSDRSLEEALAKIAGAGFKQVELWGNQAHLDPRKTPNIRAIRDLLHDLDLHVYSVHLPFSGMDLGYPDRSLKDGWLHLTGTALEYCAQLGGRIAVMHVSGAQRPVDEEQYEDSVRMSIALTQELRSIADQLGVRLALENLLLGKCQFGSSLAELAQVFPDEELGFCLDTGHAAINRANIATELQAAGQRLLSVHANNNDGLRDSHQLPSQGVLDWREVEDSLAAAGYGGCRMLEVSGRGGDPDVVLEQLQDLWRYI